MAGFPLRARVGSRSARAPAFRVLGVRPGAALPRLDTSSRCRWVASLLDLMHELCSLSDSEA
jgi:hypothetical protein